MEKANLINGLVKYINSNQYTIQFNNFADKFFESLEKITDLVSSTDDGEIKELLFNKMFSTIIKDERYSILIPSFIANFITLFTDELPKERAINLFSKQLSKLNPLTMNSNYYRMFLRDAYKIALNDELFSFEKDELNKKLDMFLESYMQYSDYLIPDKQKVEFLEYLTTFELLEETKNKIVNWVKSKPELNVKIITITDSSKQTKITSSKIHFENELVLNDIKCGSCLREMQREDVKQCDYCNITLCLSCFIEFEFSGDNCPGVLFGNKLHKFKIKGK